MKKIELLAPAGSYEKAKIAFMYGADAVYCGTPKLSLRSRSEVEDDDVPKIVEYAHSIGKKVFVAVNIYAFDETYDEIIEAAKILNNLKVDGVLVSDGGVFNIMKEYAPDIDIHISTQANTVSYHTAQFWHDLGAKRIVLGRELSKNQINDLMKNKPKDLEVEMFGHGALCFAYSGRCFLSEFLSGRSANLGSCSHCCRWEYNIYIEERNKPGELMPIDEDEHGTYIMSSRDLCLIHELPEIINMQVDSLKIEGRLKTEYYLATVVNAYRHAIDDYYNNPESFDAEKYLVELEKSNTRKLTTYFFNDRNNKDFQDYSGRQYNANCEFGGVVLNNLEDGKTLIEIRNKLSIGDTLEILVPGQLEPVSFKIDQLWNDETGEEIDTVNPGKFGQKVIMRLPIKVEENWILRRMK